MERLRQTDRAQAWMRRRVWPRNALYDQGEHDIRFDGTSLTWVRKTRDRRLNRQSANLLGVRGDHWVADLTQGMPAFTGVPENRDLDSRRRAKSGERLMMADWRRCNLDLVRSLALRDVWRFGAGFIETVWDPQAGPVEPVYQRRMEGGKPVVHPELNIPIYDHHPTGERIITGYKARGAVVDRPVSPLLVYVPITTELPMMEACAWVIRLEWATEHVIRAMADQPLGEDFSFDDDLQFRYTDDFLARIGSGERRARSSEAMGLHLVAHYYELRKPVEGFTEGKHYVVTSEKCIAEESLQGWGESTGDRYNLFLYSGRPRSRTFWSQPEIQDRIPTNRRYNQMLTHELAYLSRFSMPTPVAAKGSEVPDTIPFDGTTVQYNATYQPPTVLQVPPPPPSLFQGKAETRGEIDDVGGDEPASRGVAVTAPSALYIQYLQDAAGKRVGPLVRQHAWSWARMGELHCQLHAYYEGDEQILSVIGRRNRPELVSLRMDELGSVAFHVSESSLSGSIPSARIGQLQTVVPTFFGPPPYPAPLVRAFLDFVRMPDVLDLETGTSGLDDWIENAVVRIVDEGEQPSFQLQELEPDELQALSVALKERRYAGDFFDWTDEVRQRHSAFKAAVQQAIQAAQDQATQAQDAETAKGIDAESALEQNKQSAQAEKGIRVAYARARAEALKEHARPFAAPQGGAPVNEEDENAAAAQ